MWTQPLNYLFYIYTSPHYCSYYISNILSNVYVFLKISIQFLIVFKVKITVLCVPYSNIWHIFHNPHFFSVLYLMFQRHRWMFNSSNGLWKYRFHLLFPQPGMTLSLCVHCKSTKCLISLTIYTNVISSVKSTLTLLK